MATASSPAPEQIKETRKRARVTQTEAAKLLNTSIRAFQQWEYGECRMHPAFWELFLIKTGQHERYADKSNA